jgi:hypothetical protein
MGINIESDSEDFRSRDFTPRQKNPTFWNWMWDWYETQNGYEHVAAYPRQLDVSKFTPKEPPLKTEAFWAIANANRAREETELAEVLAIMGNPSAVTLSQILKAPMPSIKLQEWLSDRKNRRVIPRHMEAAEYVYVHNPDRKDGLWSICGLKQAIYARMEMTARERVDAARDLVAVEEEARVQKTREAEEARARMWDEGRR